jgi:hypothetical protein
VSEAELGSIAFSTHCTAQRWSPGGRFFQSKDKKRLEKKKQLPPLSLSRAHPLYLVLALPCLFIDSPSCLSKRHLEEEEGAEEVSIERERASCKQPGEGGRATSRR